jgi:hypothetical protein
VKVVAALRPLLVSIGQPKGSEFVIWSAATRDPLIKRELRLKSSVPLTVTWERLSSEVLQKRWKSGVEHSSYRSRGVQIVQVCSAGCRVLSVGCRV